MCVGGGGKGIGSLTLLLVSCAWKMYTCVLLICTFSLIEMIWLFWGQIGKAVSRSMVMVTCVELLH